MLTGDCLPVVYFDGKNEILGLAHLGWRGVDKELAGFMVEKMAEVGADPENLQILIGPGVRKETYLKYERGVLDFKNNVDLSKWEKFMEDKPDGKLALDLVGYVGHQVTGKGVLSENIKVSEVDTVADRNYFSQFRSDKSGEPQGRFATVVMLK